eukprot:TRINITY_DN27526_c0_g1_i1.p1 TRINITY_DN27526_c0_g1~~TRINITY_DN27526_c0_g1_i1.p1  ORF type:complete len:421 (-),score=78.07 TRINITY_DN27526_c0_g1_i1:751-2013(-)
MTSSWLRYDEFRAWVRKRRRVLLLTAGAVGIGCGTYLAVQYYQHVAAEARERKLLEYERMKRITADEQAETEYSQLLSHFESVQKISDSTTLPSVLPHLKARLFESLDLSSLTEKLMAGKQAQHPLTSAEKMQIWQDLKVLSFTRTFCAMWSVSLLDLFVRTQLNILGRRVYFDTAHASATSASEQESHPHRVLTLGSQHKFIAFADFLPLRGLDALIADCHQVVRTVVQSKPLKELLSLHQLRDIFDEIRTAFDRHVSQGQSAAWVTYVLPEDDRLPDDLAAASSEADATRAPPENGSGGGEGGGEGLDEGGEMLQDLMAEARRVLASASFWEALARALDSVTDGIMDELQAAYGDPTKGIHLAKLLPPIASVGSSLLDQPQENLYIKQLAELPEVKAFCERVYADTIRTSEEGRESFL